MTPPDATQLPTQPPTDGLPRHRPWEVVSSREIYSLPPWITLSLQTVRLPNGRVVPDYHRLRLPDYTIIYAITTAGRVLVARQYRHGIGRVTLALPAGCIDAGEDPIESARRELLEETGHAAPDWRSLGSFVTNSNYGCGRAHLFVATGARLVAPADPGDLEDLELIEMTPDELLAALQAGEVGASSMAAAIAMATHPALSPAQASREKA